MSTQPPLRPDLLAACQLLAAGRREKQMRREHDVPGTRLPRLVGVLAELAEAGGRA